MQWSGHIVEGHLLAEILGSSAEVEVANIEPDGFAHISVRRVDGRQWTCMAVASDRKMEQAVT